LLFRDIVNTSDYISSDGRMIVYKNLEGILTYEVLPKAQAVYYPVMYMNWETTTNTPVKVISFWAEIWTQGSLNTK